MENWILQKFESDIGIVHDDWELYLKESFVKYNLPRDKNSEIKTMFDWPKIAHRSFFFDFDQNEKIVNSWLSNSKLTGYAKVIIEFGPGLPVIEISSIKFIESWYDFVGANGYSGTSVMTENWDLVLEFTDDTDYLLYSNFIIKPESLKANHPA